MRARDKFVHRWKADRQVGHPVILAGPAQMIGRAFYSTMASTDDIFEWIFCQSTSDIHCYRDVKSIPWNITKSVSRAGFSNLPTPPLTCYCTIPSLLYLQHTVQRCGIDYMAPSEKKQYLKHQCLAVGIAPWYR